MKSNYIFDDLYEYDFKACHFNILNNLGYDLTDIEFQNKEIRNIKIGILQKDNPNLKIILSNATKKLIEIYKKENHLTDTDIIWEQKDGFIISKKLDNKNLTLKLSFRGKINKLIKTLDGKKILIFYKNDDIEIKGITNKPIDTSFYKLFLNINYSNRKIMFENLQAMKHNFLKSNKKEWFIQHNNDNYIIPLKSDEVLYISKSSLNLIDIEDIDKEFIFNNYIYPFIQVFLVSLNRS